MINVFKIDIVILSLLIFSVISFGGNHTANLYRAVAVSICFIYAGIRYIMLPDSSHRIISKYGLLLLWIVTFFYLYFFYGNLYCANINSFGGNDTAGVLLVFSITILIFIAPYDNDKLIKLLEISFSIALVGYIIYIIKAVLSMSAEELLLYRMGEQVGDEGFIVNGNSNTVAACLIILSIFIFYHFIKLHKLKLMLPTILITFSILTTGSKKGFFSIILYFIIFAVFFSKITSKQVIIFCLGCVLLLCAVFNNEYLYFLIGHRIEEFLGTIGLMENTGYSNSTELRLNMYVIGFNLWLENPIIGNGISAFKEYSGLGVYAHNNYIELLSSFGICGFFLYYSLSIYILVKCFRMRSKMNYILEIIVSYYVISFFFDTAMVRYYDYLSIMMIEITYCLMQNEYKISKV